MLLLLLLLVVRLLLQVLFYHLHKATPPPPPPTPPPLWCDKRRLAHQHVLESQLCRCLHVLRNVLLTSVKRRKLNWHGHVTRSSGLAKTILKGTVQGGRRGGRQRKRWEDSVKEWTGLEWNIIQRKAENPKEWRNLVVKSTVVPQRSTRVRGR